MAKIIPFKALQYSTSRVPIQDVVTQPYDKISKEMQQRYYDLHPNNLVRILLGKSEPHDNSEDSVYTRAAKHLAHWRKDGVIEESERPSLFAYFQKFKTPGTDEVLVRKGFVCLLRLEDYAKQIVFPHERTMKGPKKDRLELLRHTRTHFGQVLLMYSDKDEQIDLLLEEIATIPAEMVVLDEHEVEHSVWRISDANQIKVIQSAMADRKVLIADGHHRYETALAFRDEMRKSESESGCESHEWLMTTMVNMESKGVAILPTHRVLSGLPAYEFSSLIDLASEYFEMLEVSDLESIESGLTSHGKERPTIGLCSEGVEHCLLLKLRSDVELPALLPTMSEQQVQLDVVILHQLILDKCLGVSERDAVDGKYLSYERGLDKAVRRVRSQDAQLAFLLNPTRMDQVREIAFRGEVLPQKSTDFFPKVLSGFTMYSVD